MNPVHRRFWQRTAFSGVADGGSAKGQRRDENDVHFKIGRVIGEGNRGLLALVSCRRRSAHKTPATRRRPADHKTASSAVSMGENGALAAAVEELRGSASR